LRPLSHGPSFMPRRDCYPAKAPRQSGGVRRSMISGPLDITGRY
jgi:hypothetical protein